MSYTTKARTIVERAPIDDMTERDLARVTGTLLQGYYSKFKGSAKRCANDAGASVQSAKNWLSGMCVPSTLYLKRLERKVPGLAAEMRRLQAMEAEQHPSFQNDWAAFIRLVQSFDNA